MGSALTAGHFEKPVRPNPTKRFSPFRSVPRSGPAPWARSEGMPSLGEAPNGGAQPFGSFLAFEKGTRCKSETASSRYQRNGYAPNPSPKLS
jgi:hypothetical protein